MFKFYLNGLFIRTGHLLRRLPNPHRKLNKKIIQELMLEKIKRGKEKQLLRQGHLVEVHRKTEGNLCLWLRGPWKPEQYHQGNQKHFPDRIQKVTYGVDKQGKFYWYTL